MTSKTIGRTLIGAHVDAATQGQAPQAGGQDGEVREHVASARHESEDPRVGEIAGSRGHCGNGPATMRSSTYTERGW
mgnify:CR=1 FL=1